MKAFVRDKRLSMLMRWLNVIEDLSGLWMISIPRNMLTSPLSVIEKTFRRPRRSSDQSESPATTANKSSTHTAIAVNPIEEAALGTLVIKSVRISTGPSKN